jgi:hypothetical protein
MDISKFHKGVKFERGENWFHKTQVFHFLFSVFLYAIIQSSNQKKKNYSKVEKILGRGHLPPSYAYDYKAYHQMWAKYNQLCGSRNCGILEKKNM